jgi:hypothetical protein
VPSLCGVYPGICLTTEGKKHGKTSVRLARKCQLAKSTQNRAYLSIRIHKHDNKDIMMCPDDREAKIKLLYLRSVLSMLQIHASVYGTMNFMI